MYAGRNLDNTADDIVFYGMNSYWEPLQMRLPHLPNEYRWKVVANTYFEYSDETDFDELTKKGDGNLIFIPERTTIVLIAEQNKK
jgi:glycogen operon protein